MQGLHAKQWAIYVCGEKPGGKLKGRSHEKVRLAVPRLRLVASCPREVLRAVRNAPVSLAEE